MLWNWCVAWQVTNRPCSQNRKCQWFTRGLRFTRVCGDTSFSGENENKVFQAHVWLLSSSGITQSNLATAKKGNLRADRIIKSSYLMQTKSDLLIHPMLPKNKKDLKAFKMRASICYYKFERIMRWFSHLRHLVSKLFPMPPAWRLLGFHSTSALSKLNVLQYLFIVISSIFEEVIKCRRIWIISTTQISFFEELRVLFLIAKPSAIINWTSTHEPSIIIDDGKEECVETTNFHKLTFTQSQRDLHSVRKFSQH